QQPRSHTMRLHLLALLAATALAGCAGPAPPPIPADPARDAFWQRSDDAVLRDAAACVAGHTGLPLPPASTDLIQYRQDDRPVMPYWVRKKPKDFGVGGTAQDEAAYNPYGRGAVIVPAGYPDDRRWALLNHEMLHHMYRFQWHRKHGGLEVFEDQLGRDIPEVEPPEEARLANIAATGAAECLPYDR
ncbi:MAG: hypothetical protein ACREEE_04485, partial [Dongiaceae bacterium]